MYYAITTNKQNQDTIIALEDGAEEYLAELVQAHSNPVCLSNTSIDPSWIMAQQSLRQFLTQTMDIDTIISAVICEDIMD